MYYISIKDIFNANLSEVGITTKELKELTESIADAGVNGAASYLNTQNIELRNRILTSFGMNVEHRIQIKEDMHRLLNGESKETFTGVRWCGRSLSGESIHEVHQDLASDEKYIGVGDEIGQKIRPTNKKFLRNNPDERLTVREAYEEGSE